MTIGTADRQTSSVARPSATSDDVDDLATALRHDTLGNGTRDLGSWRIEPSAYGIARRTPISLINDIGDPAGKKGVCCIRALPGDSGIHSGGLCCEAVTAMLSPSKVAQPFDRAKLGDLPLRMGNALAGSTPSPMLEIVRGHFEVMSVLAKHFQLGLGGHVLLGKQGAAPALDERRHPSEEFFLGRACFPAALSASMSELALRALSSRDIAGREVAVFTRPTRKEPIDTKLPRFLT